MDKALFFHIPLFETIYFPTAPSLSLCCNFRDFPDKVIDNPDFLHLLAVYFLDLANQNLADKPVQYRFIQFLDGSAAPDFPDKGADFVFLFVRMPLHQHQVLQALLIRFLFLFQSRRQLHKPLFGQDAFGLVRVKA